MANSCGSIISPILSESTSFAGIDARGRVRAGDLPPGDGGLVRGVGERRRDVVVPASSGARCLWRCCCCSALPFCRVRRVCRVRPYLLLCICTRDYPCSCHCMLVAPGIGRPTQLHHRRSCVHDCCAQTKPGQSVSSPSIIRGFRVLPHRYKWPPTHQPEAPQSFVAKQFWIRESNCQPNFLRVKILG